ncbi:MAG TPA: ATP-binding protein [Candidatus Lustribacter sp.]|nr:ATP-binding protein [Candidatus Lustribacter sp.]
MRQSVMGFARGQGIEAGDITDFVTALGEALANAIEHSHTAEPITIVVWVLDDRLFASVSDRGVGFQPAERGGPEGLSDTFAERGRGLGIMRRFADVLSVRSIPGQGTRVTLGCNVHHSAHPLHCAG